MFPINCSVRWNKTPSPEALGNFELLLDEELAQDESNNAGPRDKSRNGGPTRWK